MGGKVSTEEIQIKPTTKKESIQQLTVQPCVLISIYATWIEGLTDIKPSKRYSLITPKVTHLKMKGDHSFQLTLGPDWQSRS